MNVDENGLYVDAPVTRYSQSRQVSVTASPTAFVPASAKRCRLEIRSSGGAVVVVTGSNLANTDTLFRIATQFPLLILDKNLHGTMVQNPYSLQVAAGTELCTITETMEY